MHGETLSAEADPISDVREWLSRRLAYACAKTGLPREHFLLDPGIGFGKTPLQNLQLLAKLPELRAIGQPILLALSRKSYIAAVSGEKEAAKRLPGTIASLVLTRTACDIVRVHDVAETLQAFHTAAAIDSLR